MVRRYVRSGDKISIVIWDNWPTYWEAGLSACSALGGHVGELKIAPPATESSVRELESRLGQRLPESLRRVLLQFSSAIEYRWYLPEAVIPPAPFSEIFGGTCLWDLNMLVSLEEERKNWVAACFPNISNSYDAVWHNKLAFTEVGNGDLLALDLSSSSAMPVIYLSHDDGEGHGYKLADDFDDFINRWSLLGCPGPEDWQMWPFISSPDSGLEPHNESAQQWRKWFGLRI